MRSCTGARDRSEKLRSAYCSAAITFFELDRVGGEGADAFRELLDGHRIVVDEEAESVGSSTAIFWIDSFATSSADSLRSTLSLLSASFFSRSRTE